MIGLRSTLEVSAVDEALSFLDEIDKWFLDPDASPDVLTLRHDWSTSPTTPSDAR